MALVPPYIADLRPYEAGLSIDAVKQRFGLSQVVKLASNENPLGASPVAIEAVQRELTTLNRYPSGGLKLRQALAALHSVSVQNVIAGSGSEGILSNIIRTFLCDDDEVLTSASTFIGFKVLAQSRGVAYRTVPYRNYRYDLDAIASAINSHTKIIYLVNPNNPTGTHFSRKEFDAFYERVPERCLIILDEAYIEYARQLPDFPDSLQYRYDNVITLRTFSKVYGLAGLRVGYGFAHEALIANLLKVKLPFEPSTVAEAAAIAALGDAEFLRRTVELNERSLKLLTAGLNDFGLRTIPSSANFVMVEMETAEQAADLANGLLEAGVIIRHLKAFDLPRCVRISSGTIEETEACLAAVGRLTSQEVLCRH